MQLDIVYIWLKTAILLGFYLYKVQLTDLEKNLNFKIAAMSPSTSSGVLFKKEDILIINQAADSLEYYENQNKLLKSKLRQLTDKYNDLKMKELNA